MLFTDNLKMEKEKKNWRYSLHIRANTKLKGETGRLDEFFKQKELYYMLNSLWTPQNLLIFFKKNPVICIVPAFV